jgi:hypothetical protein
MGELEIVQISMQVLAMAIEMALFVRSSEVYT